MSTPGAVARLKRARFGSHDRGLPRMISARRREQRVGMTRRENGAPCSLLIAVLLALALLAATGQAEIASQNGDSLSAATRAVTSTARAATEDMDARVRQRTDTSNGPLA